jgi:hypothetical protein
MICQIFITLLIIILLIAIPIGISAIGEVISGNSLKEVFSSFKDYVGAWIIGILCMLVITLIIIIILGIFIFASEVCSNFLTI